MTTQQTLEQKFSEALAKEGDIPAWEHPYKFNLHRVGKGRKMDFDFAWPEYKVAVEINGGQWARGKMGHNSGAGVERDARKQNYAALDGWLLIWLVTDHIDKQLDTYTIPTVRAALLSRGAPLHDFDTERKHLFETGRLELEYEECSAEPIED